MQNKFRIFLCVLPVVTMAACSNTAEEHKAARSVEEIYSGFHCSHAGNGSIEWVTDRLLLERAFARLSRQFSSAAVAPPQVNFSRERVAIIYMGQQRTAGYSLQLARQELRTYKGTAEVTVAWKKPQPGMMTAQVITSPCIVLKMPASDYTQFQVVDTSGDVRLRSNVPGR